MDELLQTIAEQQGYPAELVQRAAQARAQAAGVSVEDLLRSWAGGDAPAPSASPAAPPAASAPAPAESEPAAEAPPEGPKVEVLEPAAAAEAPEDETPEPEIEPEPVPVRTGLPRWLVAAFMVVPSIGLLYALVSPAGPDCGSSGALAIDPETGVAENCDGTEYGVDASDLFSIGQELYDGRCASCHGGNGGGGVGPAFTNGAVLATFSSCADHVEWVVIGSNAWPEPTYGDNATPVLGSGVAMPGFEGQLTLEEIIAVSLYERVAFGGEDRAAADENCAADEEMLAAP